MGEDTHDSEDEADRVDGVTNSRILQSLKHVWIIVPEI